MKIVLAVCLATSLVSGIQAADNDRERVRHVDYITVKRSDDTARTTKGETAQRPLRQVLDYLSGVSGLNISVQRDDLQKLLVEVDFGTADHPRPWRDTLDQLCRTYTLRLDESQLKEKIVRVYKPALISVAYKDADIRDVIFEIATAGNLNVIVDPEIQGKVTAKLNDVPCDEALDAIVKSLGYSAVRTGNGSLRFGGGGS